MEWRSLFKENIANGGHSYVNEGAVSELVLQNGIISADVTGLEVFHVRIKVSEEGVEEMSCTCPLAKSGVNCKHMAATLIVWEQKGADPALAQITAGVEMKEAAPVEEKDPGEKMEPEKQTDPEVEKAPEEKADPEEDITSEANADPAPEVIEVAPPTLFGEDDTAITVEEDSAEPSDDHYEVDHDGSIELQADINTFFSYALQQNRVPVVRTVTVKNLSEHDITDLAVRVRTDVDLIDPFVERIDTLAAGEEHCFKNLKIMVHGDFLASLTERISCILYVSVTRGSQELASRSEEISVLAFDQWPGYPRYYPDLLAAFITPNHPAIVQIMQAAVKYLEKWTKEPSLDGYQSEDPNRILSMAAAVYAAIQEKNITYSNPPAGFEDMGQRVRLVDQILDQHMGTCLDMTLFYVSVLEAMCLNPILVMKNGHIFAGVWVVDDSFPDPWTDDPSQLEKRLADGVNELVVVECTAMCAGKTVSFDEARKIAEESIRDYEQFEFSIDVVRARRSGVRPLPIRIKGENGYVIDHSDRDEKDVTAAPGQMLNVIDTSEMDVRKQEVTKQIQWERKLLDLSLRNMLINMRITGSVIPILTADLGGVEDSLAEGAEFEIIHRPAEWTIHQIDTASSETVNDLGPYADLIALEAKHHRLHSWTGEKELEKLMTKMYRSAKSSMEENGASTLYLTLGQLRWFDGIRTPKVHYAPIILIPIDIIRKSASKGYVIRERDDDAQVNITLLEFLKQNYEIEIGGLNPPPKDDHGLDVEKIFAIVRHAVMHQKMWDVVETSFIGNFSFTQFVMWNDIHSRSDLLGRNKIVRALMNGAIDWDCKIPENVDDEDAYLPVPVDASQLHAVNMAAGGVSFVLHGPPGTGKSQTITAMIANALTKGKTVLFVAEKMAALEVVQKRLAALGIKDFCLELHSNKAVKKNVLDQLKRGLEIRVWGMSTDYDQKIEEVHRMRTQLDAYAQALHKQRKCGMSVRELIDEYESIPEETKTFRPDKGFLASLTYNDLDMRKKLLLRLIDAGKQLKHPQGHPLSVVGQTRYTQSLRIHLRDDLYDHEKTIDGLQQAAGVFSEAGGVSEPVRKQEWRNLFELADSLRKSEGFPAFLMREADIESAFNAPINFLVARDQFIQYRNNFINRYDENILTLDLNDYAMRYEEAGKKLLGKSKAIDAVTKDLQRFVRYPVAQSHLPMIMTETGQYREIANTYEWARSAVAADWWAYINEQTTVEVFTQFRNELLSKHRVFEKYKEKLAELQGSGRYGAALEAAKDLDLAYSAFVNAENGLNELLALKAKDDTEDWLGGKRALIRVLDEHSDELRDWISYCEVRSECVNAGLGDVCKFYEEGLAHDELIPVFLKSVYKQLIWDFIEEEPVLNEFTGNSFNERIKEYKRLEQEFLDLTKQEMYHKLTHNLPTDYGDMEINRELAILRKAISSGGRGLSIRTLFDQIPHVLAKLCPCFLMSPISVAQYLSADNDPFDVVIFDEASQLPTCKAVGVLARGNDAVIVGDPNQMPPTSFFAGSMIDEDNLDIEDLDSILDDCLALGLPQAHLQWHYRSRHESLIAFSNREYYENSMLTFPSVNDRERRVKLCTINGLYSRKKGRVNEEEGNAVVKEVLRRYHSEELNKQTIGIVTFNINQQGLIEDLLTEAYKKDAEFDKWANEREESLFVKNLENVQGDERDVILFSVGYGPDEEGKVSMNFGPLNREGGWKRLNVAVSRARQEMIVFSSMTPEMIDLNRIKSKGVEGLRAFLEYAAKGRLVGGGFASDNRIKGIAKHICDMIEASGLKVQKDVGHSDFKIDLAVVNPYDEDEYLLGIMLDGDTYRRSANTKDREISQIGVLNSLGWELHRIWTMDWWDNREKELSKLMNVIEERKEAARIAAENAKPKDAGPESEEIEYKENEEHSTKERKSRKKEQGNMSFDTYDKFAPQIPHTQSKDELLKMTAKDDPTVENGGTE